MDDVLQPKEMVCNICNRKHDYSSITNLLETVRIHEQHAKSNPDGAIIILFKRGIVPTYVFPEFDMDFTEIIGTLERVKSDMLNQELAARMMLMHQERSYGKPN